MHVEFNRAENPVVHDVGNDTTNGRDRIDHYTAGVGLARLRRDTFASLDAGAAPGRVRTRPLTFRGRAMFVSAEVAEGGWAKAAALSKERKPLASYGIEDSRPLTAGSVRGRMSWRSTDQLAPTTGNHIRLLFELRDARLYAFRVE